MTDGGQTQRPWTRLPVEVAEWLRPETDRIAAMVVEAIPREVAAFASDSDGKLRDDIRAGVLVTVDRFLHLVAADVPALSSDAASVYAGLGASEARERRGLEPLLAAYRVGSRVLFREMSLLATAAGADPNVLVDLGDAVFTYMDVVSAVSAEGYAASAIEQAGERTRRRQHLAELVVAGTGERHALGVAARHAGVELATTYRVVLLPAGAGPGAASQRPVVLEERGLVLPRPGDLLVLVPGTEGVWMERVLSGTAAAVGPEVELGAVPSSLRLAERVLGLAEAAGGPVRADDHLAAIALTSDPTAIEEIRRRRLAPLDALRPGQRERLLETLRAWLLHWGQRGPVARDLYIHPQTVGYRLGQLRSVLGDALEDPAARFEMLLALEAERAALPDPDRVA